MKDSKPCETPELQLLRKLDRAHRLLRLAVKAIDSELDAAGMDEVADHPILRAKDKLARRIWNYLDAQKFPCDQQYTIDGGLHGICGRALGHKGDCGRND